jgi:squalene synthase HpnC
VSVQHYENFPVASWLCPPKLRAPVTAIYWFARTADDIADEGSANAEERRESLLRYRSALGRVQHGQTLSADWPEVFEPLAKAVDQYALPTQLLEDLLLAFLRDVEQPAYASRSELMGYCQLSANPIGRLLLHLHEVRSETALHQSDCICSALQLINFWQDLSVDLPRGRCYVPCEEAAAHGVDLARWKQAPSVPREALVKDLCSWAEAMMLEGTDLVHALPGRAGWELRLVVQGGLRILEKIAKGGFKAWHVRPKLRPFDVFFMLIRSVGMMQPHLTKK